jgi:hypothetical protein
MAWRSKRRTLYFCGWVARGFMPACMSFEFAPPGCPAVELDFRCAMDKRPLTIRVQFFILTAVATCQWIASALL